MKNINLQTNRGFSTLLIVIILGATALSLVLALSTSNVWSIRGSMNTKTSNITKSLVDACAEVALEAMRENNSYVGTNSVLLNSNTCSYTVANTGGNSRSISISGTITDITRKINITTSAFNPIVISSWTEIP